MDQPAPAISVIMPAYNRAASIGRAIDSVLAQDFSDFELIVVDDGSSDGTAEVVAAVADPRVRLIRLDKNGGGNAARNRGIDEARAPLLAFLDSDDAFLPHKLGFAVAFLRDRPEIGVLLDSFVKTWPDQPGRPDESMRNAVLDDNEAVLEALFTRRIWKATPAITVRRAVAIRAGRFDEGLKRRQDFDFIVRLAAAGRCATTDEVLWTKSATSDAISADLDSFIGSVLQFHQRHPAYLANPAYRRGLALDLARHFKRLAKRRRGVKFLRDLAPLVRAFGLPTVVKLLRDGRRELEAHRTHRRASRRN
ncbi:glycosyltransferase family 2 protein [Sphingomonas sp.]|uniref:glycosyltransferase family 2 protein n=1 Tax=Sphingomonas sp. TaxID=28214 RepID=UPI00286E9B82|nr:glycosyltransferase family 2 protein [Sphingomonas sp.]